MYGLFVVLFFKELFIKESMNILFIITQHMFIRKSLSEALEDKHLILESRNGCVGA